MKKVYTRNVVVANYFHIRKEVSSKVDTHATETIIFSKVYGTVSAVYILSSVNERH